MVGIGTGATPPSAKLDVNGSLKATSISSSGLISGTTLKLTTGAFNNYILTTDALGNASWKAPAIVSLPTSYSNLAITDDAAPLLQVSTNSSARGVIAITTEQNGYASNSVANDFIVGTVEYRTNNDLYLVSGTAGKAIKFGTRKAGENWTNIRMRIENDGTVNMYGNAAISNNNTLEFGAGVVGKEVRAGKIGYQTFGDNQSLDIVGAGTNGTNRKIKFWNEGGAAFNGFISIGDLYENTDPLWISRYNVGSSSSNATELRITIGDDTGGDDKFVIGSAAGGFTKLFEVTNQGFAYARKSIVTQNAFPDYVFDSKYELQSLEEVEDYIKENKHLPGIPSAKEVAKEGLDTGEMLKLQMEKIEELTLHIIRQQKEIDALKTKVK